ncbi:MAG: 50S ribosomal protein L10 [Candidatus Aenigmatarchaeota archaeon]
MVSEKKKRVARELTELVRSNKVVGIVDMHKLPAKQLFEIRKKLKGKARIVVAKKRVIQIALKSSGLEGIEKLSEAVRGEPALLFSNENPFKLSVMINESKSTAFAKPGEIAPHDIEVKAGPTSLPPGPAIGELQRIKIPAGVEGDKIVIRKDTVVAKAGEVIQKPVADVLAKLGIEPMEIGLNLVAVWENGIIYSKEILSIPPSKYLDDVKQAFSFAFNLAFNINYYTSHNIQLFLSKAYKEALALAENSGIVLPETIPSLFARAKAQHDFLEKKLGTMQSKEEKQINILEV